MEAFSVVTNIVILVIAVLLVLDSFYIVRQKTAAIIERLGKFQRVSRAGFQLKIPVIDRKAGIINLKVRELPVEIETKTKDDVFVHLIISVQFFVVESKEGIHAAYYKLDNPERQIQSYVFDSIRSEVPRMELDDVFSEKDKIALAVQQELSETMQKFGYDIIKALVTDIDPDHKVKESMNEINAAKRLKEAAKEKAAAEKIKVVAAAEAEAESKRLQGEGIANQRIAIANGMKRSVQEVKGAMEQEVTGQEIMNMLFLTQHYDTVSRLADSGVSTIFMPYSPNSVGDLQTQIQASLLNVDNLKSMRQHKHNESNSPEDSGDE